MARRLESAFRFPIAIFSPSLFLPRFYFSFVLLPLLFTASFFPLLLYFYFLVFVFSPTFYSPILLFPVARFAPRFASSFFSFPCSMIYRSPPRETHGNFLYSYQLASFPRYIVSLVYWINTGIKESNIVLFLSPLSTL